MNAWFACKKSIFLKCTFLWENHNIYKYSTQSFPSDNWSLISTHSWGHNVSEFSGLAVEIDTLIYDTFSTVVEIPISQRRDYS